MHRIPAYALRPLGRRVGSSPNFFVLPSARANPPVPLRLLNCEGTSSPDSPLTKKNIVHPKSESEKKFFVDLQNADKQRVKTCLFLWNHKKTGPIITPVYEHKRI